MGFVMVGLLGFGAVSFNGSIQSVGSVGDTEIPVDEYARGLQNELRASEAQFGRVLSFSEAQAVGIADRVLSRLVQEKRLRMRPRQFPYPLGMMRCATKSWKSTPFAA